MTLNWYKSTYNSLIEKRRTYPLKRIRDINNHNYIYCENHHIIPKSMGGLNNKENLILLTAREHFIAHMLLLKIYQKENNKNGIIKMGLALKRLIAGNKEFIDNIHLSARQYEILKVAFNQYQIELLKDPKIKQAIRDKAILRFSNPENRKKLSDIQKLRYAKMTEKEKQQLSKNAKLIWENMSDEEKSKICEKRKISAKKYWENLSDERRKELGKIYSEMQLNFSQEQKEKIKKSKLETLQKNGMIEWRSKWTSNHVWIKNPETHESKFIDKTELESYISNGWIRSFYKSKHSHPRIVSTIWICNDNTGESKHWKKSEPIPFGWRKGRLCKWNKKNNDPILKSKRAGKGKFIIHNDQLQQVKRIDPKDLSEYLNNGWKRGYLHAKNKK